MPDPVTHYVFGMQVLSALDKTTRDSISQDVFERALHGPDPWSTSGFYGGKSKQYSVRSSIMHKKKTGAFLRELTVLAQEMPQSPAFAFLAGFICHYCLDRQAHPYIVCKGGDWSGTKNTSHLRGGHVRLERAIDCYFIRKTFTCVPWHFSVPKRIMHMKHYPESLRPVLDQAFARVYGWQNGFALFNHCLVDESRFYALMQDPLGLVHYLLRPLSKRETKYCIYSYYRRDADSSVVDYLNLRYTPWHHPHDQRIVSQESFLNLFDRAKEQAVEMIHLAYQAVYNNESVDLQLLYGNSSYSTGLDCEDMRNLTIPQYEPLVYKGEYWNS